MNQVGTKVEYSLRNTTRLYPLYVAAVVFAGFVAYDISTNGWDAVPSIRPWEENSFGPSLQGVVAAPLAGLITFGLLKYFGLYGDSKTRTTTTTVMEPKTTVKKEVVWEPK